MAGKALSVAFLCAASATTWARAAVADEHRAVDARYVFAPIGFDDNDETMVVIDGYLPSGCYKLAPPEVKVDAAALTVRITPKAHYFNAPCIEALVPYHQAVRLGVLPVGKYKIEATATTTVTETLVVAEAANAGPDDFLYAPIDDVSVKLDAATGKLVATLAGRFTDSCMAFDELRVIDNGQTINLLPIIAHAGTACQAGDVPFKKTVELPDSIAPGRHLLHVRSLNGSAANALFTKNNP